MYTVCVLPATVSFLCHNNSIGRNTPIVPVENCCHSCQEI